MKNLGTPTTLGEFRKLTENYSDETLLQFRNEPVHDLIDIDGELCFNETNRWDNIVIGGIGKERNIFIIHDNIVRYPTLPLTIDDSEAQEIAKKTYLHQVEFALRISPEVIEKFKNQTESLKASTAEAILALEDFGEKMIDSDFHQNKKHKGHERPYKYHR